MALVKFSFSFRFLATVDYGHVHIPDLFLMYGKFLEDLAYWVQFLPVFDCFQYVKSGSKQNWMVGRPGNETSSRRMQQKSSSASSFSLLMLNSI